MEFPEQLRYSEEHEWVAVDGVPARIGITDFAQDALGDVVYVELPDVGADVMAHAQLCRDRVDQVGVGDLLAGHRHHRRGQRRARRRARAGQRRTRTVPGGSSWSRWPTRPRSTRSSTPPRTARWSRRTDRRHRRAGACRRPRRGSSTPPARWRPTRRCSTPSPTAHRRRCALYRWSPPDALARALPARRRRRPRRLRRASGSTWCAGRPGDRGCCTAPTSPTRSRCRGPTGAAGGVDAVYPRLAGALDRRAGPRRGDGGRSPGTTVPRDRCASRGQQGADLRVGDRKLCGSAQVRRGGAVLQHGSILLDRLPFDETDLLVPRPGTPAVTRDRAARRHRHARGAGRAHRSARGRRRAGRGLRGNPRPHASTSSGRPRLDSVESEGASTARRGSTVTAVQPVRGTVTAMRCRQCGHQNESGANFCSSCGSPLPHEDEATLSLTELAERLELDEELGAALAELPEGMGMLVVRRGPNAGSRYVLDSEVTALGRHPDSDIFLDDITVSRRHAAMRAGRRRLRGAATSGRSTAPTSTTSGSTPRRCTTWPTSRSAGSCSSSSSGSDRVTARPTSRASTSRSARCSPSSATSSPTSRSRRSASSRARGSSTPSARRRATGSSTPPTSPGSAGSCYQQKEHFLPLKVIKERLDELPPRRRGSPVRRPSTPPTRPTGAVEPTAASVPKPRPRRARPTPGGRAPASSPRPPRPRRPAPARRSAPAFAPTLPADDGADDAARRARRRRPLHARRARGGGRARRRAGRASSRATGCSTPAREIDGDGLSTTTTRSRSRASRPGFFARGVEARHLRMYRTFAEREAVLFGQVLLPYVRQRNPEARARLQDELGELASLGRAAAHRAAARAVRRHPRRVSDAPQPADAARRGGHRRAPSTGWPPRSRADHPDGVVLVGVLKGASIFLADLARAIRDVDVAVDFIAISRYAPDSGGCASSTTSTSTSTGRDVVLVEDLVDTGLTRRVPRDSTSRRTARAGSTCARCSTAPARRILPVESATSARRSPTCSCSGTGCISPTCTATSRGSSSPIATWSRRPRTPTSRRSTRG